MKAIEIIKYQDIPEDSCDVCYLHRKAKEKLKDYILCPHCGARLKRLNIFNSNSYKTIIEKDNDNNIINKHIMPTQTCTVCSNEFAFKPIPIIYNGNHNIYYTGGRAFLVTSSPKITPDIMDLIEEIHIATSNNEDLNTKEILNKFKEKIDLNLKNFTNNILKGLYNTKPIDIPKEELNYEIVGEQNSYIEDAEIENMPVICNDDFSVYIGFKPIAIKNNNNSLEIYYDFKNEPLPTFTDEMEETILNFIRRVHSGEPLKPSHLEYWLACDLEGAVANFLYKTKLKY